MKLSDLEKLIDPEDYMLIKNKASELYDADIEKAIKEKRFAESRDYKKNKRRFIKIKIMECLYYGKKSI